MMPNKTIYVKETDLALFEEVQESLGRSISSVFSDFLKSDFLEERLAAESLRKKERLNEYQAMNELLETINAAANLNLELHPFWRYPILEQTSLNHGFKFHQKGSDPDRIMSLIFSPYDAFDGLGRVTGLMKQRVLAEVQKFWSAGRTDVHICVDLTKDWPIDTYKLSGTPI